MIYLWSDLHFNHRTLARLRGYGETAEAIEAMNEWLVAAWNEVVGKKDDGYILGDFGFGKANTSDLSRHFMRLRGRKHLIIGNHDEKNSGVKKLPWTSMEHQKVVREGGHSFFLCHYPVESWPQMHYGRLHAHGHTHGSLHRKINRRQDVGADVFPYPVDLVSLGAKLSMEPFERTDGHHDEKGGEE